MSRESAACCDGDHAQDVESLETPLPGIASARSWIIASVFAFYRMVISPLLGPGCRFEPSCSHFSEQAIRRHGFVHGVGMTISRLARCHPFHPGGYDPVP